MISLPTMDRESNHPVTQPMVRTQSLSLRPSGHLSPQINKVSPPLGSVSRPEASRMLGITKVSSILEVIEQNSDNL